MKRMLMIVSVALLAAGLFAQGDSSVFKAVEHEKYWNASTLKVDSYTYQYYVIIPNYCFTTNWAMTNTTSSIVPITWVTYWGSGKNKYYYWIADTMFVSRLTVKGDFEMDWGSSELSYGKVGFDEKHGVVTSASLDGEFIWEGSDYADFGTWSMDLNSSLTHKAAGADAQTIVINYLESADYQYSPPE
jgi:hypothetical protein